MTQGCMEEAEESGGRKCNTMEGKRKRITKKREERNEITCGEMVGMIVEAQVEQISRSRTRTLGWNYEPRPFTLPSAAPKPTLSRQTTAYCVIILVYKKPLFRNPLLSIFNLFSGGFRLQKFMQGLKWYRLWPLIF